MLLVALPGMQFSAILGHTAVTCPGFMAVLLHAASSVQLFLSSVPVVTAAPVCCLLSQMFFMFRMAIGVRKSCGDFRGLIRNNGKLDFEYFANVLTTYQSVALGVTSSFPPSVESYSMTWPLFIHSVHNCFQVYWRATVLQLYCRTRQILLFFTFSF